MMTNKYFLGQNYFLIVILFEAPNNALKNVAQNLLKQTVSTVLLVDGLTKTLHCL
jgi:hypothetical protein